ncbi:MAG: transposase [Roseimicrobium sp.]
MDSPDPMTPPWPHAPPHRLEPTGTYFVTAGTYLKEHHFQGGERLKFLHDALLQAAITRGWQLDAWAVFSNHYHVVARRLPSHFGQTDTLSDMLGGLHRDTSTWLNDRDRAPGRKVWHNFRDTPLTYEKSYIARLGYVHRNPVKHGLVKEAKDYPWCSAAWFERVAAASWMRTVYAFKTDELNIEDDF